MVARRRTTDEGFTLMEIMIAIVILAFGLTTLLGLQSASVERTLRDRNKQQAMLMARSILALVETTTEPLDVMKENGTVREVLAKLQESSGVGFETDDEALDRFQAELEVDFWSIPNLDDDALKRVLVRVFWSDDPRDELEVIYFVPGEDQIQQ